ncbi:DUF397 domain-containing protein [Streptomyces synnematoformans]|uniref:DUF397 domain-containing protein n=1 Tax=Streptomyces synnematoformans TaxID=415721 RepID=A0ABN1ZJZ8_9ACTN
MNHIDNASTLAVAWWKSSHSGAQGDCVEVGIIDERGAAVRDSKDPAGPALLLTRDQLAGLVAAVRAGRFEV